MGKEEDEEEGGREGGESRRVKIRETKTGRERREGKKNKKKKTTFPTVILCVVAEAQFIYSDNHKRGKCSTSGLWHI